MPPSKIRRIYNPATRPPRTGARDEADMEPATVLTMGNVGATQNLVEVTRAFQASEELSRLSARFKIAGDGIARDAVRAAITTDRVRVTGILGTEALEREMRCATIALVSQRYEGIDFNVPSKLMNFMACGLPVVASARPESEVARIVSASDGGWVVDCSRMDLLGSTIAQVLGDPSESRKRGQKAIDFAHRHFAASVVGERFDRVLREVLASSDTSESPRGPQ